MRRVQRRAETLAEMEGAQRTSGFASLASGASVLAAPRRHVNALAVSDLALLPRYI